MPVEIRIRSTKFMEMMVRKELRKKKSKEATYMEVYQISQPVSCMASRLNNGMLEAQAYAVVTNPLVIGNLTQEQALQLIEFLTRMQQGTATLPSPSGDPVMQLVGKKVLVKSPFTQTMKVREADVNGILLARATSDFITLRAAEVFVISEDRECEVKELHVPRSQINMICSAEADNLVKRPEKPVEAPRPPAVPMPNGLMELGKNWYRCNECRADFPSDAMPKVCQKCGRIFGEPDRPICQVCRKGIPHQATDKIGCPACNRSFHGPCAIQAAVGAAGCQFCKKA